MITSVNDEQQPTYWSTPLSADQREKVHSLLPVHHLYLYARQGKSRFIQLWNFHDLCDSNVNLLQVSSKLSDICHVLPEGGDLSQSLADQFLLIQPLATSQEKA
jgi:hypothetical protein